MKLYLACMRLSLPLLAVSNAKNYVHIFTDFLKYWATASDAEKELVTKYGFTLETVNGVTVSLDYGHEKYVRLVRDSTGKIYRRGSKARIEFAGLCCMDKHNNEGIKTAKTVYGKHDYIEGAKKDLKRYDGYAFIKLVVKLKAMGSFVKVGERAREPNNDALHSMHKPGKILQLGILEVDSTGTQLIKDYLTKFVVIPNPLAKREDSNLKKQHFSAADSEKLCQEKVVLAGSTKSAALQKGTAKELLAQLEQIRHLVPEGTAVPRLPASASKSLVVLTLVALKTKAFEANSELRKTLMDVARSKAYGGALTKEVMCAEMDRPFYSHKLEAMPELTDYEINL